MYSNVIKKILTFSAVILSIVSITSCDGIDKAIDDNAVTLNPEFSRQYLEDESEAGVGEKAINQYISTDEDAGVQYVIYREQKGYAGLGGITPRLNYDGSLYGIEVKTENTEQ